MSLNCGFDLPCLQRVLTHASIFLLCVVVFMPSTSIFDPCQDDYPVSVSRLMSHCHAVQAYLSEGAPIVRDASSSCNEAGCIHIWPHAAQWHNGLCVATVQVPWKAATKNRCFGLPRLGSALRPGPGLGVGQHRVLDHGSP